MKEEESNMDQNLAGKLPREKDPPRQLEQAIVDRLENEGLIKKDKTMNTILKWAAIIAAVVGAYFLGNYSPETQPKLSYMLILMEDDNFKPGDPMVMFGEYRDWMIALDEQGVEITGQELKDEAILIEEGKEDMKLGGSDHVSVTGYFLFGADSKEQALKIAHDNPHIRYGGKIQLKEFMIR